MAFPLSSWPKLPPMIRCNWHAREPTPHVKQGQKLNLPPRPGICCADNNSACRTIYQEPIAPIVMATLTNKGIFYTEELSSGIRAAQVLGLTATAFFCGKTYSQSFSTTPALLQAPAPLLARQWKTMFDSDKALSPAVVALGSSIFTFLASRGMLAYLHADRFLLTELK